MNAKSILLSLCLVGIALQAAHGQGLGDALSSAGESIQQAGSDLAGAVKDGAQQVGDAAKDAVNNATDKISDKIGGIGGGGDAAGNATEGGDSAECMEGGDSATIAQAAENADDLSTLYAAVVAAGLGDALSGGMLTVFAPTNDAFAALLEALNVTSSPEDFLKENTETVKNILLYHVVDGAAQSGDLSDGQELTTLQGGDLKVDLSDGVVIVGATNNATVIGADVLACNGVVHVIDTVLLPAAE